MILFFSVLHDNLTSAPSKGDNCSAFQGERFIQVEPSIAIHDRYLRTD